MQAPAQHDSQQKAPHANSVSAPRLEAGVFQPDNRPGTVAQRQLADAIAGSPRMVAQRSLADAIANSPRMVAQRQAAVGYSAASIQREVSQPGITPSENEAASSSKQAAELSTSEAEASQAAPPVSEADEAAGQQALLAIRQPVQVDMDEDGKAEQHTLRFAGEEAQPELMIYSDPKLLTTFLASRATAKNNKAIMDGIDAIHKLQKKTISLASARTISWHLANIAGLLQAALQPAENVVFPNSRVKAHNTTTLTAVVSPKLTVRERVPTHLVVEPLSILPGPDLQGSAVQQSATPYMQELHNYSDYIRGHTLNSKVHGPGVDDNLIPISRPTNSEWAQATEVEGQLKKFVWSEGKVVSYEIIPSGWGSYSGMARAEAEKQLPTNFSFTIKEMRPISPVADLTKSASWVAGSVLFHKNYPHKKPVTKTGRFDPAGQAKDFISGRYHTGNALRFDPLPARPGVYVVQGQVKREKLIGLKLLQDETIYYDSPTLLAIPQGVQANAAGDILDIYEGHNGSDTQAVVDMMSKSEKLLFDRCEALQVKIEDEANKILDIKKDLKDPVRFSALVEEGVYLLWAAKEWKEKAEKERKTIPASISALIAQREEWGSTRNKLTKRVGALESAWRDASKSPHVSILDVTELSRNKGNAMEI